jgi:hypothetical protein
MNKEKSTVVLYLLSFGKFKLIDPRASEPYRIYPKNPTKKYKIVTRHIPVFNTPLQPP